MKRNGVEAKQRERQEERAEEIKMIESKQRKRRNHNKALIEWRQLREFMRLSLLILLCCLLLKRSALYSKRQRERKREREGKQAQIGKRECAQRRGLQRQLAKVIKHFPYSPLQPLS